ncbi:MAG: hypothetical protein CME64_00355 [Halobacteriovoraceae bacterium]|nr:hypothetical protein [Halobacteriovoraceae bacterium]|tara:strand:+ start:91142 stop:91528 length:387 start_codon:yes stop_codon:yes gene_type:complete
MTPTNRNDFNIQVSKAALEQIKLIKENDYTLNDEKFRLKIGGKGCDGFTYDTGFSTPLEDDVELEFGEVKVILDPFTAHYCKEGSLDFLLNPKTNEDGFVFINFNEEKYHGKFFKDESMAPPLPESKA